MARNAGRNPTEDQIPGRTRRKNVETNTKKKIGLLGCIGTGIGAIIGSGIFGSLPTVINDIGTGIVLALLATIVYTLAKTIPNVYLSSVAPASGSFFIAPTKLIHPAVGVFMAAQNLLQPVLISVFILSHCSRHWKDTKR